MRPNDFEPRRSLTRRRRRGVASVLSMMFLVIFGSLAAAMAVVASGNVRTADVSLRVSRSTSAAETGLVYGTWILEREASRFVVRKGEIDAEFTAELWNGTYDTSTDGEVIVSPADGYVTSTDPSSLAEAVRDAHLAGDRRKAAVWGGRAPTACLAPRADQRSLPARRGAQRERLALRRLARGGQHELGGAAAAASALVPGGARRRDERTRGGAAVVLAKPVRGRPGGRTPAAHPPLWPRAVSAASRT